MTIGLAVLLKLCFLMMYTLHTMFLLVTENTLCFTAWTISVQFVTGRTRKNKKQEQET